MPTAAFLILGPNCTRNCGFCAVSSAGPHPIDMNEPSNVAEAATEMGLRYVVITSVTRDDLDDGGASQFVRTITAVRNRLPDAKVEVLVPDFMGNIRALDSVIRACPDVFNHNIETVSRLYPVVRPMAEYQRSLSILRYAAENGMPVKSGFMLGLGETMDEVNGLLEDLIRHGCSMLTIGQYLRPTLKNLPVVEYIPPEIFEKIRGKALAIGFSFVASGPLVRSSMNAEETYMKSVKST
jgi:lipoic acid synthetase